MALLEETLEQVRQRQMIEQNRNLYRQSEESVRIQLINPVLTCLGWGVENPAHVGLNVPIGGGFADYALFVDGTTIAVVEAKNQNINLDSALNQAITYASAIGARYTILTNGNEWRLYWTFVEGFPTEKCLIWKITVVSEADSVNETLSTIRRQERVALASSIEKYARATALDDMWSAFSSDVDAIGQALVPAFKQHKSDAARRWNHLRLTLSEIKTFVRNRIRHHGIPPRTSFDHPEPTIEGARETTVTIDGEAVSCRYKKGVLNQTAEWLIRQGKLVPSACPVKSSTISIAKYLVNTEPKQASGNDFSWKYKLSNGLWIEQSTAVQPARRLLKHFGYDPNILVVEWDD